MSVLDTVERRLAGCESRNRIVMTHTTYGKKELKCEELMVVLDIVSLLLAVSMASMAAL